MVYLSLHRVREGTPTPGRHRITTKTIIMSIKEPPKPMGGGLVDGLALRLDGLNTAARF